MNVEPSSVHARREETMSSYPYPIKVVDTRPDGHQSLRTLPRLGVNDIDLLQEFYKFELLFTHG